MRFIMKRIWATKKGSFHGIVKTALGMEDAQMAVEAASIIPVCSYIKGKDLFSYENKPFLHPVGGDKRDRTADLLNAIQALSQLSYTPVNELYNIRKTHECQEEISNFPINDVRVITCHGLTVCGFRVSEANAELDRLK